MRQLIPYPQLGMHSQILLVINCHLIDCFATGWILAQTINGIEKQNPKLGKFLDVFSMLPFAVSSVMIGLGVMLGMIKINPGFFYKLWFTPVIAHVMITTYSSLG